MKVPAVFVCGTDTGVGKTLVTAALCAWFQSKKINAGAFKPFESGCTPAKKNLHRHIKRADASWLKKMARMSEDLDTINPYFFGEALAPGIAAGREHKKISFVRLRKKFRLLQKKYSPLFVEGAGGLLVPLAGKKTNVDLIRYLKVPVLLVARRGLGTINHTLLTLEHLKKNNISVLGVILNETTPNKTIADQTNPNVLKKWGVPLLGIMPHLKNKSRASLTRAISCSLQHHGSTING